MKKWLLCTWLVSLLVMLVPGSVFAALSPEAVKQAKQEAPVHVTGLVKADATYRDLSTQYGHPLEIRKMTLEIKTVVKKPVDLNLSAGNKLDVYYNWYPNTVPVPMTGPSRVGVMVGDELELWLKKGPDGWAPVLSGDTINPIKLVEPRPTMGVPVSFEQRAHDIWRHDWVPIVFIAITGIFAGMVYLRAARR